MHQIFEKLNSQKVEFSVRVSFLELYNEELFDLLTSQDDIQRLRIFEDSARKVRSPSPCLLFDKRVVVNLLFSYHTWCSWLKTTDGYQFLEIYQIYKVLLKVIYQLIKLGLFLTFITKWTENIEL